MSATFRLYGSLNDFLPPRRRQVSFDYAVDAGASVKDAIEAVGVPHPEVDLILADGVPVDFSYHIRPDDRIAVYPAFQALDVPALFRLVPAPPDPRRFVLDGHLGRLAAYLRLAGFDTLYENGLDDETLAKISSREDRILLTRDVALLKRGIVVHGCWLRDTNPRRQLSEVAARFDLAPRVRPFTRCLRCNGLIGPVPMDAVIDRLPPRVRAHFSEFYRCAGCERAYWKGSHYEALRRVLEERVRGSEGPRSEGPKV